jgi:hypothetical protein
VGEQRDVSWLEIGMVHQNDLKGQESKVAAEPRCDELSVYIMELSAGKCQH